ncbi:SsrA-binding protein [Candidatus Saccharibacteria bacterium]|nr:SsrA-binding protein [Candidatus Saccharibacteria bacterium]
MGKKKKPNNNVTVNRRARFDYQLEDELTCGMSLSGPEVRSIRDHHVQLKGSFVTVRRGELWLNNLTLGSETARNIRLLATKKQILSLERAKQDGISIVPLKLLAGGRYIKLVIATGKGKKKYDKRKTIKNRDLDREERRNYR